MAVYRDDLLYEVLFLGRDALDSLSAPSLCLVGVGGLALHVSRVSVGYYALVALDKVLKDYLVLSLDYLRAAVVSVFVGDLLHFVLYYLLDPSLIGKDLAKVCNKRLEPCKLLLYLMALKSRQLAESHINDCLRLNIGQSESIAKGSLRFGDRGRGLHYLHDLVYIVKGDLVALEDVRPCKSSVKVKLRAAGDDLLLKFNIPVKYFGKREDLRLVSDDSKHIYRVGTLELGVFVELIEKYLRVHVAAELYYDAHTVASRLIPQLGDPVDALFAHEPCYALAEHRLVDTVGYLGEDYPVLVLLDLSPRADHYPALARPVSLFYPRRAVDYRRGRKIGAFKELHELLYRAVGVIHSVIGRGDRLAQVMRRNVRRHTDGDTHRTVYKQVRKARRKHRRLAQTVVKVRNEVNDLFLKVARHLVRYAVKARLGVTVGSSAVAVDRTEISVPLYKRIPV